MYAGRYQLAFAMLCAICIALLLTIASMGLYVASGTAKLDLSRPGYESARKKITKSGDETDKGIASSGKLTDEVMSKFLADYQKEAQAVRHYDVFDPHLIGDAELGIAADQPQASQ